MPIEHREEQALPNLLPNAEQSTCVPLFKVNREGTLLHRKEVNNPLCKEYTANWHAIPTLIECWLQSKQTEINSGANNRSQWRAGLGLSPKPEKELLHLMHLLIHDQEAKQSSGVDSLRNQADHPSSLKGYENIHGLIAKITPPQTQKKIADAINSVLFPALQEAKKALEQRGWMTRLKEFFFGSPDWIQALKDLLKTDVKQPMGFALIRFYLESPKVSFLDTVRLKIENKYTSDLIRSCKILSDANLLTEKNYLAVVAHENSSGMALALKELKEANIFYQASIDTIKISQDPLSKARILINKRHLVNISTQNNF